MRGILLVVFSMCGGSAPTPAPAVASTDPVIQSFVDHSTLVVRGVATVSSEVGEYAGTIRVGTIYKGMCGPVIPFVSEPFERTDHDAIFFLINDNAGRWRVTLTGPNNQGLSSLEELRVIAAIHDKPGASAAFATDLSTFRDGFAKPWTPANQPAVTAAERIFDQLSWIGASPVLATKLLGKPDTIDPQQRWHYVRHNGQAGVSRILRMEGARVVAVEIQMTQ